ncbi:MAG: pentapeptide repeat-containing protein, partial [Verrucomicrobiota bacterium]
MEHLGELKVRVEDGEHVTPAGLYEIVIREWLDRDEGKHRIPYRKKPLLMESLATHLWKQNANTIHVDDLEDWVDEEIKSTLGVTYDEAMARLEDDARTATFVVRDGDNEFCFAHRSLQEFFLARSVMRGLSNEQPETLDLPLVSRETVDFLVGLLTGPYRKYRDKCCNTINRILESSRVACRSENAFLIYKSWLESHVEDPLPPTCINLVGADLERWTFTLCSFDKLDVSRANLRHAVFRGVNVVSMAFSDADLRWCTFRRCDVTGSVGRSAQLAGSNWIDCKLDQLDLTNVGFQGVRVIRCSMKGVKLAGIDGRHSSWAKCDLDSEQLQDASFEVAGFGGMLVAGHPVDILSPSGLEFDDFSTEIFGGHAEAVTSVCFSPDGKYFASGADDHTIKIWDAEA